MSSQQLDNDPSKTANCECINMYINQVHKYIRKIKFAVPLHTNLYIDYSLQTFLEMSKCNGFARFLRYSVPPPLSAQRLSNVSSTRMLSLYIFQAIILPPSFVYSKRVVGKKRRLKRCSTILTAQHTLYTEEEKRRLCKTRGRQRGEVDEASAVLFELVSSDSRGERISCPRSKALSITRWLIQEGKSDSSMRLRSPSSLLAPALWLWRHRTRHRTLFHERIYDFFEKTVDKERGPVYGRRWILIVERLGTRH